MVALQKLNKQLSDEDSTPLVWIHDYHLMLTANAIRQVQFNPEDFI